MPSDRSSRRLDPELIDRDGDQKHHRRYRDHLPSETPANDAKTEVNDGEPGEKVKGPDPTTVPRSRSYFQHDDRGIVAGRSVRRDTAGRGFQRDYRDNDERATHEKDSKLIPRAGYHVWRHDRFSEVNTDSYPPAKKRRHFREEKVPLESPTVKTPNPERREERGHDHQGYGRESSLSELPSRAPNPDRRDDRGGYGRERSLSTRGWDERYRGRDWVGGGRQGYRGGGGGGSGTRGQVQKWKHDMYDEGDASAAAKNDEDPVAKVEALLAL